MNFSDDIVICNPVRTPVGADGGQFASVEAVDLSSELLKQMISETGIGEDDVDDVILGHGYPNSEAANIGRVTALDAGLGVGTAGLELDRRCSSGVQSIVYGVMQVAAGVSRTVVAGGVESMSQAEHYLLGLRRGAGNGHATLIDRIARGRVTAGGKNYPVPGGMLETAENLRMDYGISRADQDEFAYNSHKKADAATKEGRFRDEIRPVTVHGRKGASTVYEVDEQIRPDVSLEKLATLRPVRGRSDSESTVTAGNACGQSDGASLMVVTTRAEAERLGLTPFVRLVSWAVAGVRPDRMGIGPVPATAKALTQADLKLSDMDLIEVNEAFAVQVMACLREWNFTEADYERFNVNGSGIALGHPVGATGARILTTMAHEMRRRDATYGLETMCMGGGQGFAAVFERVA